MQLTYAILGVRRIHLEVSIAFAIVTAHGVLAYLHAVTDGLTFVHI